MTAQIFVSVGATPVEYTVPRQWTALHVELRLVEALECVMAMDEVGGPAEYGNAWPGYADDWAVEVAAARAFWGGIATREETARAAALGNAEVKRIVREVAQEAETRIEPPTMEAITRMEIAIGWPGRYLGDGPEWVLRAVQHGVGAKAQGQDIDCAGQESCLVGCAIISRGLTRDRVAVF